MVDCPDICILGVCDYQMLVGELLFRAPTVPCTLMKHIPEPAPMITEKRPDCPEDLAACVMRCLEKEPESRWPTADALRRALESRSAAPYRPRRSIPTRPGTIARRGPDDLPPLPPAARSRQLSRRAQRRDLAARGQG